jgi:hypothetical protein
MYKLSNLMTNHLDLEYNYIFCTNHKNKDYIKWEDVIPYIIQMMWIK